MNPYLMEVYKVFREQLALIFIGILYLLGNLYLEDFGFNEEMFILK